MATGHRKDPNFKKCIKLVFQVDLPKPEVCEKEVWELQLECWNRDEKARPNFSEISLFLKRKSMSFSKENANANANVNAP